MSNPVGLSIGSTNLVAARVGNAPVTRSSVLTLFPDQAPVVGIADPARCGVVMSGFVERVGDPIPLVAPDGSRYHGARLMAEASAAMVSTASGSPGASDIVIAVPTYWSLGAVAALRDEITSMPALAPAGVPARVISDAYAALTALQVSPGLPTRGVVALLDFGATGTSLSLADAGAGFTPIDGTLRYGGFSGDEVDQLLLTHVLDGIAAAGVLDTAATAAVESLSRLRAECRQAKERLSMESATELIAEFPGHHSRIRLTRAELEEQIREPLAGVVAALEELLRRNNVPVATLAAVATVGGGSSIPLIHQVLSEHLGTPMVTTARPEINAAAGAALMAARGPDPDAPTASVAGAPLPAAMPEPGFDDTGSSTFGALAWSEDDNAGDDVVPYVGEDYLFDTAAARPPVQFVTADPPATDWGVPWYRRPLLAIGLLALVPLIAIGAAAYALTGMHSSVPATQQPAAKRSTHASSAAPPPAVAPPAVAPPTVAPPAVAPPAVAPPAVAPPAVAPPAVAPTVVQTTTAPAPPPPPPTTTVPPPVTTTKVTTTTTPPPTTTTPPPTTTTTTNPPADHHDRAADHRGAADDDDLLEHPVHAGPDPDPGPRTQHSGTRL